MSNRALQPNRFVGSKGAGELQGWLRIYIAFYVLLLILLAVFGAPVVFPSMRYSLTHEERAYLASLGTLRAVGDDNFPPFSYVREGRSAGFERDLVLALEAALDVPIEHVQLPWSEARTNLEQGKADFATGMRILPEREELYRFTNPYKVTFHGIIVPRESTITKMSDLEGRRVAAQRGSATFELLTKRGIAVTAVKSPEEGLALIEQGAVDAWVEQYWVARFLVGFRGMDRWAVHPIEGTSGPYAMAVSLHSDERLVNILNKGLLHIKANGELTRIHAIWFGPTIETGQDPLVVPILMGVVGLATLGLGLIVMGGFLERQVARKTDQLTNTNLLLFSEQRKLKKMLLNAARALGVTIEIKDFNTGNHSQRVARVAYIIAKQMGLSEKELFTLYLGALMHDIGKVGVPDFILAKAEELTSEEYREMRFHPEIGDNILRNIEGYDEVRKIVLYHHERWDGNQHHRYPAYPGQRFGEAIPLGARIVAVADSFDAITSARPYRDARPVDEALRILRVCAGMQFDPAVVEAAELAANELRAVVVESDDDELTVTVHEQFGL